MSLRIARHPNVEAYIEQKGNFEASTERKTKQMIRITALECQYFQRCLQCFERICKEKAKQRSKGGDDILHGDYMDFFEREIKYLASNVEYYNFNSKIHLKSESFEQYLKNAVVEGSFHIPLSAVEIDPEEPRYQTFFVPHEKQNPNLWGLFN